MKLRSTVLVFASLLMIGHLASPGQASPPADPASADVAAIFSASASLGCADVKLPSFEPAPTAQAAFLCGSCSDPICQGKQRGGFCKFQDGMTYTCQPALFVCSAKDCQCWTGPLP
ncbi:MAG TPA: hypothetical protein VN458_02585 [Solirubrobacterales bacterium]|nr:hypothetical protein [Solirubrobacterales bacterium]